MSAPTRRETRARKVSQRMAIVDESTRQQVGAPGPAPLWVSPPVPHHPCYTQRLRCPLCYPTLPPHCPTAACLLQAAQSRLDALEQDNPDDGGDPFGLLDDDDDEFVMQDSDQDGACLWTPSVALR